MTPEKKSKLKDLLARIKTLETSIPAGEIKSLTDQIIGEHVSGLADKVKGDTTIKSLSEINDKLNKFKADFQLGPVVTELNALIEDVSKVREELAAGLELTAKEGESKYTELQNRIAQELQKVSGDSQAFTQSSIAPLVESLTRLQDELSSTTKDSRGNVTSLKEVISGIDKRLAKLGSDLETSSKTTGDSILSTQDNLSKATQDSVEKLRKDIMNRLGNLTQGGGNANRNIAIGGNTSVLSKYTDINLKAGSNVTITYAANNTTKYTDVTISASGGGGGSVGGTVRSINNISTSQTAGNNSGTDYVYIASAGVALTLPTAAANTNMYTIKNTSNSSVVVLPDAADTIDTSANAILSFKYTSIDVISDGTSNWSIT